MTASAENGGYHIFNISNILIGLSENVGADASFLSALWPASNNSGWMMLKIPPINANGRVHFSSHSEMQLSLSRSEDTLRWCSSVYCGRTGDDLLNIESTEFTSCPCSNQAGEILNVPGFSPPPIGWKWSGPDLQFADLPASTLIIRSKCLRSENMDSYS